MKASTERRRKSIFRKTAVIFVVVALVPVTVLGLRAQHLYTDEFQNLEARGLISHDEVAGLLATMETQSLTFIGYGLVIALVMSYFFAASVVRPIRMLQKGAQQIGNGDLDLRVETDTEDELEDLAAAINQMAGDLQAREAEIRNRNHDLSILYEIAHSMSESHDPRQLLEQALEKVQDITGSTAGCVLLSNDKGEMEPLVCCGRGGKVHGVDAAGIFTKAAGEATRSGLPVLFDYSGQPDGADEGGQKSADASEGAGASGEPRFDAIACIPLKCEAALKGALCLTVNRDRFTKETLNLLSAIGSEVAVAVENARLFKQLEGQNAELALSTTEIASLISEAESQKSFGTRYQNPNLVKCWELKDCGKENCPGYGGDNLRCWQIAGTHCGGEIQGVFAQKLGRCEKCEVFQAACPDRITLLGETFNNMMAVLERHVEEQEDLLRRLHSASKLAAIGELAAGVAHEINNPLTGILGSALLMRSQNQDPEDLEKKISVIEGEALRARDIVRNLLDFAHQERGLNQTPTPLPRLIEQTLFLVGHQTDLCACKVTTSFAGDLPDLSVDPNQIKQVFMNIIHNALQAMPGGGRLDIRAQVARAGHRQMVEVSFSDTGGGIDKEELERIFDPFYTTKRIGEGTGLGLSVSQRIVNEHGGEIRVRSKPGEGSTFTVFLPVAAGKREDRRVA